MSKISDHRHSILKETYANPFQSDFDSERLVHEFGTELTEDEKNILDFLHTCNRCWNDLTRNIYNTFDKINFSPSELRQFLFIATNKYFLDMSPRVLGQMSEESFRDSAKSAFYKFTNDLGQTLPANFVIEISGDILGELVGLSHEWKPQKGEFNSIANVNLENYGQLFHLLWVNTNLILNLRNSAFHTVAYENGIVILPEEGKIKVEIGLKAVHLLKTAGEIRSTNNLFEYVMPAMQLYKRFAEERQSVIEVNINSNTGKLKIGKAEDHQKKVQADSALLLYYPHFTDVRLDYFEGLTLIEVLELLVLIEEIVHKISQGNIKNYTEKPFAEIPTKISVDDLISFLSECTNFGISSIRKFIDSITSSSNRPYLWREPLWQEDGFIYFSLAATVGPNHSLFLDKWTNLSGYSLEQKQIRFKEFVLRELSTIEEFSYQFDFIDFNTILDEPKYFENNLLIETSEWLLLIEVSLYDLPIESPEIDQALQRLGNASYVITEKAKRVEKIRKDKPIVPIILTNYSNFSSLHINEVPVFDLTLFKNYVVVGKYRTAQVVSRNGESHTTDAASFPYYKNELQFNRNLITFLANPAPVHMLLQRFRWKEIEITPPFMSPVFLMDIIDHIPEQEYMDIHIGNLSSALNYEFYANPEDEEKDVFDDSIYFSLSSIFHILAHSSYKSYEYRISTYHAIQKTKNIGFTHLLFYIDKSLVKLNGKRISLDPVLQTVEFDSKVVFQLIHEKASAIFGSRLSEVNLEGFFGEQEELKLISFSISALSQLEPKTYSDEELESFFLPLILLNGLSYKHDVTQQFYRGCGNLVDTLNYNHKYQRAKNFCEEALIVSIKKNCHHHGWNLLFKCFTAQKNQFEASVYGCIFLSSISGLPELTESLAFDSLYNVLRFYRDFGMMKFAKNCFETLKTLPLDSYDEQKITLSYYNGLLTRARHLDHSEFDQVLEYLEEKKEEIASFHNKGVMPWLFFLYNIRRLAEYGYITFSGDYEKFISWFEGKVDPDVLTNIRHKVFGDGKNTKQLFIDAVLGLHETTTSSDRSHESQHLQVIANNLIYHSLTPEDFDGLFLAGLVLNDYSLVYQEKYVKPETLVRVNTPKDQELESRLANYGQNLIKDIPIKQGQLFLWLFNHHYNVYGITVSADKSVSLQQISDWNIEKMNEWILQLPEFYFNSGKDNYYDIAAQEAGYKKLLEELSLFHVEIEEPFDEIFISTSLDLSGYPDNLIQSNADFLGSQIPVTNVISIEWLIENGREHIINADYSVSAWIPTEKQDSTVNWGYDLLSDKLKELNAVVHNSQYPKEEISTDINIFLAHGELDVAGFKAVYSNDEGESAIVYPHAVFGTGEIALLFICNSGSAREEFFSNRIASFSMELLKLGYKAVVAPFWRFDVTISPVWLNKFVEVFNTGKTLSQAVFAANKKVGEYDEATSNCFYAPQGQLAMHLYGNPNIRVQK